MIDLSPKNKQIQNKVEIFEISEQIPTFAVIKSIVRKYKIVENKYNI